MHKIKRYFQGVWKQAKMVRWPKRKELFSAVGVVLIVVAISAIALVVFDLLVSFLLSKMPSTSVDSSSEAAIRMILTNLF